MIVSCVGVWVSVWVVVRGSGGGMGGVPDFCPPYTLHPTSCMNMPCNPKLKTK